MRLKLKRHYKLLVLLALLSVVLTLGLGDQRIVAYHLEDTGQVAAQDDGTITGLAHLARTVVQGVETLISNAGTKGTD